MIKIGILGPESTGKSELAQKLAKEYNSGWIPEFAREYIGQLDRKYTFEDVCYIAQHQIETERQLDADTFNELPIFFDTELIITKVWFEYCYHTIPDFLSAYMKVHKIDFYLLCTPDLPWVPDQVREHGDDREFFFDWYLREVKNTNSPFALVSGYGEARLMNAIEAVNSFLINNKKT